MAGRCHDGVTCAAELIQRTVKTIRINRLNMLSAAFSGTHCGTGLQHRSILHHQTFHAKVRTGTHDAAEVMWVTYIFQRQNTVGVGGCFQISAGIEAITLFDQEANATVMFGA